MSLRRRMHAYVLGLHLVFFALTIGLYRTQLGLFVGLEVLLLLTLAGGFHLVNRALEPFDYTRRFQDLLQDQEYGARMKGGGASEIAALVRMFNKMLDALYQERLALGEQQGFLDRLLEATPSAVLVFDFDSRISLVNASAQALLGLEPAQAKGQPLAHWLGGEGQLRATASAGERARCLSLLGQLAALAPGEKAMLTDPDGRRYRGQRGQFVDRGFARHFLLLEELTAELENSERGAYEKLIRVLAHEVNNTVAATGSVLESLLYYRSQLAERDSADFCTAIVAVQRRNVSLGEFIERFTRVVKMPEPELRPTSVKEMIDDILWLNREQCKSRGIEIGWSRCDAVAALPMDRQLMEQAMLNIVKNAIEAVQAVQAGKDETGRGGGHVHLELAHGADGVTLSVTDSGDLLGQLPAHQLFTPFFTTKKGGQGIGLLFVREVLTRHGFGYRLAATGQGETRFDIYLTRTPD
ncbi:MAG: ATP-binding protein [Pseudomonadota bacterium]